MDYVDWCLQFYINTITPVTYDPTFHQIIQGVLFAVITYGSLKSLETLWYDTIFVNAQQQFLDFYNSFVIDILNASFKGIYESTKDIAVIGAVAVAFKSYWALFGIYFIRAWLAYLIVKPITYFPDPMVSAW